MTRFADVVKQILGQLAQKDPLILPNLVKEILAPRIQKGVLNDPGLSEFLELEHKHPCKQNHDLLMNTQPTLTGTRLTKSSQAL